MNILLCLHAMSVSFAWISALYFKSPAIVILCLSFNIILMTQWLVLGGCVLTQIETPGTDESFITKWMADVSQTPIEAVKQAWTLINTASPTFFQLSRLAGALGL